MMSKVYWFHFFRKPIIGKFSGTNQRSKKDRRTRKTKKMVGTMAKIDDSVKQLDETIVLHQRKLDFLKEQKKGFLQKMFV